MKGQRYMLEGLGCSHSDKIRVPPSPRQTWLFVVISPFHLGRRLQKCFVGDWKRGPELVCTIAQRKTELGGAFKKLMENASDEKLSAFQSFCTQIRLCLLILFPMTFLK